MGDSATKEGERIDNAFTNAARNIGAALASTALIKQIVQVRGEFQQLEVAFTTLLKSKEKANKLMAEAVDLAAKTPFDLQGVANGARQLLAYGFNAKDVTETLRRLGDVAAGLGLPLQRLTYLYGTTRVQGRLYARDMLQFTSSGIPVLQEMAKMYGKDTEEINKMVSAGKIGFEDVRKVINRMTSEGGQFHNLMEEQSKTITGRISNIQDSISSMFNKIGQAQEGVINTSLDSVAFLIDHYEEVLNILKIVVAAYGSYKAALILVAAWQKVVVAASTIKRFYLLATSIQAAHHKMLLFNAACKANTIGLVVSIIATAVTALYAFSSATDDASNATSRLKKASKELQETQESEIAVLNFMFKRLNDAKKGTKEYEIAKENIQKKYVNYLSSMNTEIQNLKDTTTAQQNLTKAIMETSRARLQENFIREASNIAAEKKVEALTTIREGLIERKGKELGDAIFVQARDILANPDGKTGTEVYMAYAQLLLDNGIKPKDFIGWTSSFNIAANEYMNAVRELLKAQEDAKILFGDSKKHDEITENPTKDKNDPLDPAVLSKKAKLAEQYLALTRKNEQDGINALKEARQKRQAQIEQDFKVEMENLQKKKAEFSKLNKETGAKGLNAEGLTEDQAKQFLTAEQNINAQRLNATAEMYQEEARIMQDYLQKYGDFQQQKLAINTEYNEKIAHADSEAQKRSLMAERDSRLANAKSASIQSNIDWAVVFGNFGSMFADIIKPVLEDAKEYIKTDEFKNADHSSQQAVIEAIQKMEGAIGKTDNANFKSLGNAVNNYTKKLEALNVLQAEYEQKYNALVAAQNNLVKTTTEGTEAEQEAAKVALDNAAQEEATTASLVEAKQEEVNASRENIVNTATTLKSSMEGVISGLQQLSSGSLNGAYEGLIGLGNSAQKMGGKLGAAFGKIAEKLQDVPIVGWILSIIDIFKDGLSNIIGGLLDAVFNAISGILSDVLSGGIIKTIGESLMNGVSGIFDAITFGEFSSWFDSSNAKEVADITNRLTDSNKALTDAVNSLRDEISQTGGWKAIDAAQQAKEDQEKINQQTMDILKAQMGYHAAHHSNAYYWTFGQEFYDDINKSLADYAKKNGKDKSTVSSLADIYKLTPEEMAYLRRYNVDLWEQMLGAGEYDKSEYWNAYADLAGKLEEITETLKENLTQISFQSMRDSFIEDLMDMDKSAEDFANTFTQRMMKSILNARISDMLGDELKDFYDMWYEYAESDNELDDKELATLRKKWDNLIQNGLIIRDDIAKITGYDSTSGTSREASRKGIATASQDSVDYTNGQLTLANATLNYIREDTGLMKGLMADLKGNCSAILSEVHGIREGTDNLHKISQDIVSLKNDVRKIQYTTDHIDVYGVKVK